MSLQLPRVAVIVVNWNRQADTLRCLASLAAAGQPAADVFLVDNASTDGTVAAARAAFPGVRIIENERNLGFAAGNNVGIRLALTDGYPHLMLLNNDAVVAPDAIQRLLQPLLADSKVGVAGPAICYLAAPDRVWSAGGAVDRRRGAVTSEHLDVQVAALPDQSFAADHVSGCCLLVRAAAIARAGLLDERFFMYYEETEWCLRIARHGYRIVVAPDARVWHDISPQAQAGSPAIAYYMTRNHLLLLHATKAPASAWRHTIYWQGRTLLSLYLRHHSAERVRGRWPMILALRDFALGRFGPTALPRGLR
jgi:GT2 family glycosyltransferase